MFFLNCEKYGFGSASVFKIFLDLIASLIPLAKTGVYGISVEFSGISIYLQTKLFMMPKNINSIYRLKLKLIVANPFSLENAIF